MKKTYTETITKPRLVISHDESPESPREWSNLGYFITCDSNYQSPDNHPDFMEIIKETGEYAVTAINHMALIEKEIESRLLEKVLAIFPVTKYEHSGVSYSLGESHGFDYSNNGFYIVTDKTAKEVGTKKKDFEKVIKQELEIYNQYVNGEVYCFVLYDENGELEDSCCGFYSIEDIREYLPKEWQDDDLEEYLTNE